MHDYEDFAVNWHTGDECRVSERDQHGIIEDVVVVSSIT